MVEMERQITEQSDRVPVEPPRTPRTPYGETTMLDLFIIVLKHKKLIVVLPAVSALVAALVSFLLPVYYTGTAKLLPPQQNQSSTSAMLGQLGALAGMAGASLPMKNPSDLYLAMLKSRTVADHIVQRFDLMKLYDKSSLTAAREGLESASKITSAKEGVITIAVADRDPKRAAALANAYVDELFKLNQMLAVTEASQRRLFFEKQLVEAKENLSAAETELKKMQEATGLIKLDDQGKAIIETVARLQAQVAAKEVQLGAMRSFATEQNAEYIVAQRELAGLRTQLAKVEREQTLGGGNILVPTGRIPEVGLDYMRKFRDVKYFEAIFQMLAKQFEIAKIDEAQHAGVIQVLDEAVVPELKSSPNRTLITAVAFVLASLVAIFWAFVREAGSSASVGSLSAERFEELRRHLRWSQRIS